MWEPGSYVIRCASDIDHSRTWVRHWKEGMLGFHSNELAGTELDDIWQNWYRIGRYLRQEQTPVKTSWRGRWSPVGNCNLGSTHTQRMKKICCMLNGGKCRKKNYDSGNWRSAPRDSHGWNRADLLTKNVLAQLSKVVAVGSSMKSTMESNWPGRQYLGC